MPAEFFKGLMARTRTQRSNRQLGGILAFVAGAVNAGGYLAVHRYTSHMTGIVSAIADDFALGHAKLVVGGMAMVASFLGGAITTTLLINWARRRQLQGEFSLSLMLEGALLLLFGVLGANLHSFAQLVVPTTVLLLCFIMGLQNAVITKISHAEIRTTHMTGVITDIGIELGRLLYRNKSEALNATHVVRADRARLRMQASLLGLFVAGALAGAFAFSGMGFKATIPLAALLMLLATPALYVDLVDLLAFRRRR